MEVVELKGEIFDFMNETFLLEFNDNITEGTDLFKAGIIDSFGYLKLITFLENEFHIKFSEDEILDNVFVSFSDIVNCISRKLYR
ncbi:acyl carrier protein [Paenibacillus sp. chi10]|uniref:Acyl carrier protein n=1 Tax=Paenibacillus suaedae TaxID=3077233 RepID=A0AAJ2N986_9BACL|nr:MULTISPECIES: acyl carrier protein [unclassified Paenibacillus]MDT8977369.1 acyl carrier protein [Paenibacillus sp. chi10]GAV11577.1 acyl carrier protein [Paenibacillus sp. NAIST15-1]